LPIGRRRTGRPAGLGIFLFARLPTGTVASIAGGWSLACLSILGWGHVGPVRLGLRRLGLGGGVPRLAVAG
jgi:hypothetical protein